MSEVNNNQAQDLSELLQIRRDIWLISSAAARIRSR